MLFSTFQCISGCRSISDLYLNKRICMCVCMNHSWRICDVISTFQDVALLTKMSYWVSMAASVKRCDTVGSKWVFTTLWVIIPMFTS